MKLLIAMTIFLLAGCVNVPVERKFPAVPNELKEACPDLKLVPETEKLSEVLKVVTTNYGQYHECSIKVDAWVEWYKQQQKIFESVR